MSFVLYTDLNCPYCYAFHQYFDDMQDEVVFEWRLIQHAPTLSRESFMREDYIELVNEVADVKQKTDALIINTPEYRSNSYLATLAVFFYAKNDPKKQWALIKQFYQALWLDGLDISLPSVIEQIIGEPFDAELAEKEVGSALTVWQVNWENGGFAGYIPSIQSLDQRILLGYPPIEQLKAFLFDGDVQFSQQHFSACISAPKFNIFILVDEGLTEHSLPSSLLSFCQFITITYEQFVSLNASHEKKPDCIVISGKGNAKAQLLSLKKNQFSRHAAIIVLADKLADDDLIVLYKAGVSDCLSESTSEVILAHKITTQLRLKRSFDLLESSSRLDALTELKNRGVFDHDLSIEWNRCLRSKSSLTVLMIDIDDFKAYNDYYGHDFGDKALIRVGQILSACVSRKTDAIYRYGGEEFVAILSETDILGAKVLAELILKQMQLHCIKHAKSKVDSFMTVSIGIASEIPQNGLTKEGLFIQADKALYRAKSQGKNSFELFRA